MTDQRTIIKVERGTTTELLQQLYKAVESALDNLPKHMEGEIACVNLEVAKASLQIHFDDTIARAMMLRTADDRCNGTLSVSGDYQGSPYNATLHCSLSPNHEGPHNFTA